MDMIELKVLGAPAPYASSVIACCDLNLDLARNVARGTSGLTGTIGNAVRFRGRVTYPQATARPCAHIFPAVTGPPHDGLLGMSKSALSRECLRAARGSVTPLLACSRCFPTGPCLRLEVTLPEREQPGKGPADRDRQDQWANIT
jgi:hypothetical protein